MAGNRKNAILAAIIGALVVLFCATFTLGCGSGDKGAAPSAETGAEKGAESDTSPAAAQGGEYVFSTTVSQDTKTDVFEVFTSSQTLHYNVIGGEDSGVTIIVYSHLDGKMQAGANAFEPGPHQTTIYLTPGKYYMEILPSNCSVEVKVED